MLKQGHWAVVLGLYFEFKSVVPLNVTFLNFLMILGIKRLFSSKFCHLIEADTPVVGIHFVYDHNGGRWVLIKHIDQ